MQRSGKAAKTRTKSKQERSSGNRFAVLNDFVDFSMAGLLPTDALVWLVLYRDTKVGVARTAQSDIARRAGIGRRTVVRAVERLQKHGLLTVVRHGGLNRGPSTYRVHRSKKEPQ